MITGCSSKTVINLDSESYGTELDKYTAACNLECCGEEFPADCAEECRWPGYIECFEECGSKEGCDNKCWPEQKAYLIAEKNRCN